MTSVAEVDDLVGYMSGIKIPAGSREIVQLVLDGAQADLETFLGYELIQSGLPAETAYVTDPRTLMLMTSRWPVASVQSIADSQGNVPSWDFDNTGNIIVRDCSYDCNGYTITYTPGLPPAQLNLAKLLVLRVASREVTNKHDDTRSVRDVNGRLPKPLPEGWQTGEKKQFSRWRRRDSVYSRPRTAGPGVLPVSDLTDGYLGYPGYDFGFGVCIPESEVIDVGDGPFTPPSVATEVPSVDVLRGNSWSQKLTMPAMDRAGNALDWSGSTFTASCRELPDASISVTATGSPPVVVLQLTGEQTATVRGEIHWYLAEDVVMGGNDFVEGAIVLLDRE